MEDVGRNCQKIGIELWTVSGCCIYLKCSYGTESELSEIERQVGAWRGFWNEADQTEGINLGKCQ